MAVLVLDKCLVRGQGGFVKPRWGLDCARHGNPGCAASAATLGYGMQRRWRKNLFMRTRPVGRCHSIPCDGAFDVHGNAAYPGSRETIQRDYPNGVAQSPDVHGRAVLVLDEPIQIYEQIWPELMLGQMVFSRAGVSVLGGQCNVVKEVAERSTLYFSFRRAHRKTSDLSMGWSSNSQWRTDFRRDYQVGKTYIYNVDGIKQLNARAGASLDEDGLTRAERIEHCKFRCVVVSRKPDHDLWPYDDRYEEATD